MRYKEEVPRHEASCHFGQQQQLSSHAVSDNVCVVQGMRSVVAAFLRQQFVSTSTMMHNILSQASDPMPAAKHAILVSVNRVQHVLKVILSIMMTQMCQCH